MPSLLGQDGRQERSAVLATFRKVFYLVGRENPMRWVAIVVGAAIASVFEMFGALLIYLLLALVASPDADLEVPLLGDLRNWFGEVEQTDFLVGMALVLGAFFLVRVAVMVGYTYAKHRLAHNAGARLSGRLARGYLLLPYSFHLRRSTADLVRNAHGTAEQLAQYAFLSAIQVIAEGLIIVGLLTVMLVVAPMATALAAAIVGGAALALLGVVQPRLKRLGGEAQDARSSTLATLQQSLHGIRDIKVAGMERRFGQDYRDGRDTLARTLYLRGTFQELPRLVIETSLVGFLLLLFGFSVVAGVASVELLSTLGLFAYAGLRIQPSLQKLISSLNHVRFSGSAVEHLYEDLRLVEAAEADEPEGTPFLPFEEGLRLESASFTYENSGRPAVRDAELTIRPGEMVGICGPTGGGKTTLADLLTGFLEPTDGRVTVDGRDLREHRTSWFSKLGVVPQMVFLMDDTLRANIALGLRRDQVDEDRLAEAVQLAQLQSFVDDLPGGLDAVVGERGVRISGGQRQRVAIARALYREPEVLVLDEGTSALDTATEAFLMSGLERLRGGLTIILVAHRLTTVRTCDRIVFIEEGRITGTDTFDRLRVDNHGFRALASDARPAIDP